MTDVAPRSGPAGGGGAGPSGDAPRGAAPSGAPGTPGTRGAPAGTPNRPHVPEDPQAWRIGERVPEAVYVPGSAQEVAALLAAASREGRKVVVASAPPRTATGAATRTKGSAQTATDTPATAGAGAGTGRIPDGPYAILCTAGLAGVHEYEPANLTITVGAGTILRDLARRAGARGQWLPADPPGNDRMTLGALLATGAHGPLRAGFGRPRDHALGLTVVTGDGRIIEAGGRVVKNVAGFDLVRLMVGSRGRLGVITAATVRLHPVPESDVTLVFELPSPQDAVVLARRLASLPLPIAALEMLDPGPPSPARVAARVLGGWRAVEETLGALRRDGRWEESSRHEGADSGAFFAKAGRTDDRAAFALALAFAPARLGEVVQRVEALRARVDADAAAAVRFTAAAMTGTAHVMLDRAPAATPGQAAAGWVARMEAFVAGASEAGIGCRLARVPAGCPCGTMDPGLRVDPVTARLEAGLKHAFDPQGALP